MINRSSYKVDIPITTPVLFVCYERVLMNVNLKHAQKVRMYSQFCSAFTYILVIEISE